jgi:dihydrofolate synthase/folylpolyglutamate synthase
MSTMASEQNSLAPETERFLDRLGFFRWQLGLERIEKLCQFFGQPQLGYPTVHIAGTNGKGSTAAMLAAIAKAAGLRTGLYTSPHFVALNERIQIDGMPVSFAEIEEKLQSCRPLVESINATYFETLTAIAFAIFAQRGIEIAVIETGLGGRLDATNVVQPQLTIITTIGLEHQRYLGRTLTQIASEKAGIIKNGVACVSGVRSKRALQPILQHCRKQKAPFHDLDTQVKIKGVEVRANGLRFSAELFNFGITLTDVHCTLTGRHQARNAALAVLAAALLRQQHFPINVDSVYSGLQTVHWPGRFQFLAGQPDILVDVAHNAEGMRILTSNVAEIFPNRSLLVVMGLLEDKPVRPILRAWGKWQGKRHRLRFFFATPPTERARPASQLAQAARQMGFRAEAFDATSEAFLQARENSRAGDLLCVTGSHYLIGALMKDRLLPLP